MLAQIDFIKIYSQDVNGTYHRLDPDQASYVAYDQEDKLRPRQLELVLDRGAPVRELDKIFVEKMGGVAFRGYCKFSAVKSKTKKTISCPGMEDLLLYRFAPHFFYDLYATRSFDVLLSDELYDGRLPGLLGMANSWMMPGMSMIPTGTGNIQRIFGMAPESIDRDIFCLEMDGCQQLQESTTQAGLDTTATACEYFHDINDLYISIGEDLSSRRWYMNDGLFIKNFNDTGIRLGSLPDETANRTLDGTLNLSLNKIGDLLINICSAHSIAVKIHDSWNFTYFDFIEEDLETIVPRYEFFESDLNDIKKSAKVEPRYHTITGVGFGNAQYYSHSYHDPRDIVKLNIIKGFDTKFVADGELATLVDDLFRDQDEGEDAWTLLPVRPDLILIPGDWVLANIDYEEQILAKCKTITQDCLSGLMRLDLSEHINDISDAFALAQNVDQGYTENYPMLIYQSNGEFACPENSSFFYDPDLLDSLDMPWFSPDSSDCTITFYVPPNVFPVEKKVRAVLSMSLQQIIPTDPTQESSSQDPPQIHEVDIDSLGICTIDILDGSSNVICTFPNVGLGPMLSWTMPTTDITDLVSIAQDEDLDLGILVHPLKQDYSSDLRLTGSASLSFFKRAS